MRTIPLDATPNQQVTINVGGNRWSLRIKAGRNTMVADVTLNDAPLLQGQRFAVGTPLIPYAHLATNGNFLLIVADEDLPDWRQFGVTQTLVYVDADEITDEVLIDWALDPLIITYDFPTYAAAYAALLAGLLTNNQTVSIKADELEGGLPTRRIVFIPEYSLIFNYQTQEYLLGSGIVSLILVT